MKLPVLSLLILLSAPSVKLNSQDVNKLSVVSHFRFDKPTYPTMIHSFDDGFSVKSINRAINRGLNSPEEDPGSFSVVLDQESFQGVPKWNGRISDLPVSEKRAIKLFRNNRGLFTEESRWSLEGVALMSVCEKEGDYVWIGFFEEKPLGFYSFVPQTVVYMRLDEQFVSPQPTKDGKLDHLKKTFSEKLLRQ